MGNSHGAGRAPKHAVPSTHLKFRTSPCRVFSCCTPPLTPLNPAANLPFTYTATDTATDLVANCSTNHGPNLVTILRRTG